ncbi:unnamed protein product [Prorocentrum cordatum]|uniref:PPPDE domain-containing protein n=1 Tax=Prorocentrum cordatum TaxID=2364126 RepID=A0ABN9VTK7_9DINO|nr:unnamed protein product [Polarella glacialis]
MAADMVRVNRWAPAASPTGGQHVAYHSGLEVLGTEYVFGGGGATGATGVSIQRPRVPPPGSGWTFYQSVEVAQLSVPRDQVTQIVQELKVEFSSGSYDLVSRTNCNHFSDALCKRLCGQGIPMWVNALAGIGNSLGVGNLIRSAMGQSAGGPSGLFAPVAVAAPIAQPPPSPCRRRRHRRCRQRLRGLEAWRTAVLGRFLALRVAEDVVMGEAEGGAA